MKRTLLAALGIVLMLFSFASCSNDSGEPAFSGDPQNVADQLKPAVLVDEVLSGDTADGVEISYELVSNAGAKAIDGSYTLRITVRFISYSTDAGKITDGVLVYELKGVVSDGIFRADGSCTVRTDEELVVETADGNVAVTITDENAKITASATIGTDDKVMNVTAEVTVSDKIESTVDGEDVDVAPEPEPEPDPIPEGVAIGTKEELIAAVAKDGEYYLTADIPLDSQLNITASIVLDGQGKYAISRDTAGKSEAAVETDSIIQITADDVILKNLTIKGSSVDSDGWDNGEYGIKVYDADNVTFNGVTVTAVNAGIQVNGSNVTLEGVTTVTGNIFGGIEVSKGKAEELVASTLTINGSVKCADEDVPAIWIDIIEDGNNVTGNGAAALVSFVLADKNQTWFITNEQIGKDVDKRIIQIADSYYTNLASAVEYANDGDTIDILASIEGSGVVFAQDKFNADGLTIDLNGNTYTVVDPTVGSPGTETNAFQLLKGNKITFENGKLTTSATEAYIFLQNYCDLVLDNVIVEGSTITDYVASNNNGSLTMKNGTTLTNIMEDGYAFDVCCWPSGYPDGVTVRIDDDSVIINGKVEYGTFPVDGTGILLDDIQKNVLIVPNGYDDTIFLKNSTNFKLTWVVADEPGYKTIQVSEKN